MIIIETSDQNLQEQISLGWWYFGSSRILCKSAGGTELVPMIYTPSVKIGTWKVMDEKESDINSIRAIPYKSGLQLK